MTYTVKPDDTDRNDTVTGFKWKQWISLKVIPVMSTLNQPYFTSFYVIMPVDLDPNLRAPSTTHTHKEKSLHTADTCP